MADISEQAVLLLDRLNQSAVALLDPLIDPQLANQPTLQARRLGDALTACAQSAERAGVRGLNYLVTLAVPHLHKLSASPDWPRAREFLEIWVGDVVAFCAGHLAADDVDPLMSGLQDLPEFPAVPAQFITLIRRRLAQDADVIAALAAAAMPASQPPGHSGDAHPDGVVRGAPQRPLDPVPVARDELEMLAQALQALADESGEMLAELAAHGRQARPELEREWLEVYAERLDHWCNAAGYVGVSPLAELARLAADSIAVWLESADDAPPGAHDRLGWLPAALAGFVLSPDDETASQLCLGLADARWPVSLARDQVDDAVAAITHLRLVGSRQVQALQSEITPSDLSLAIPADADPRVLDNLLIELPPLSARLSESVVQVLQGEP
ncbi:MAG: hypothetical protein KA778_10400, partial [Burkholderiaceae bacterium]|nr:hypothetical protein [Burkholderiaceae bacterium]